MVQNTKISPHLDKNIERFKEIYGESADIKMKEMVLGKDENVRCFLAYIEVAFASGMLKASSIGRLTAYLETLPKEKINEALDQNTMGLSDMTLFDTVEEAAQMLLTGDAIFFVDGYTHALKIADKGYPGMSVKESDSEKVIRGSNEGFSDSIKVNTALIRKRLRSTRLRVKELHCGVRSHTNVDLVYSEDLASPKLLQEIEKRLNEYEIDGVLDSGVIEQLAEEKWYSPFPQFQTTQRPDRAVMAILEGRVVLLCDNSSTALILPVDVNSFLKTTDDYYNRFEVATFARIIRYISAVLSMTLPGLYLAITNFHTQILPTPLLLSFWEARLGVPFPAVLEVILMEMSFELLREAGIRLPGAMGNTIGIVGGLIIGQAAVEANLVSPIVVIVVAFTALCSFAVPNEEFAFASRLLKFYIILLSAWLGYFGFMVGMVTILIHLSRLKSFGIPYLMPFTAGDLNQGEDERDALIRLPLKWLKKRPVYAQRDQRTKLKRKE